MQSINAFYAVYADMNAFKWFSGYFPVADQPREKEQHCSAKAQTWSIVEASGGGVFYIGEDFTQNG